MTDMAEAVPGALLHGARGYDLLVWLLTLGRERAFRRKLLQLSRLKAGESVLDIGCGTGTLAILARQEGAGAVRGVDASPAMVTRARKKAARARAEVAFENAAAQALPFEAGRFDLVLSTLMLHHLGRDPRAACLREARRVLKAGGRLLAVDFGSRPSRHGLQGLLGHFHQRHGAVPLQEILSLLAEAGFEVMESGPVGFRDLHYALARA